MAKRTRISKLAKQISRSEGEVLAAAKALGLPHTLPSHQVKPEDEKRLKKALASRAFNPAKAPIPRGKSRPVTQRVVVKDPLADSWMDLAMADESGFSQAKRELAQDRTLNRRISHKQTEGGNDRYDRQGAYDSYGIDDPTPMASSSSKKKKAGQASLPSPDFILKSLGFQGKSSAKYLKPFLTDAHLTLIKKPHLKPEEVKALKLSITSSIRRCCGDVLCKRVLDDGVLPTLTVSNQTSCDNCHGSNAERQIGEMGRALKSTDLNRVLVIGGNAQAHKDLISRFPTWVELRMIDGQSRATKREARQQLQWAEIAAIWGPRVKNHDISNHYKRQMTGAGHRVVHVPNGSVEQLAWQICAHLKADVSK